MRRWIKFFIVILFLQGTLWSAAQNLPVSSKFDSETKRTAWWNRQEYQWKVAFNKLLGKGKTTKKPKDEALHRLLGRTTLFLYGYELTDISGLSELDHLENVNCSYNKISSIKGIENLVNLKELKLSDNRITSLRRIKNLKKLEYLRADFNDLHDLKGLENLSNLKRVYVKRNFLSSIEPLADKPLLEELSISYNKITSLQPLKTSPKLKILLVQHNSLSNIEGLEGLLELERVFIFKNRLTNLEGVQKLKKLKVFMFSQESKILPEVEKEKVRRFFARKKAFKFGFGGGLLVLFCLGFFGYILVKISIKMKRRKERKKEFLRLRKLFANQKASFFDNKNLLYQWWNNLEDQWKRIFNVQLDNGSSLFFPKEYELRDLLNSRFFRMRGDNLTNLSGLKNCTKLERLSFYNESPKFLKLFSDLNFLARFANLKRVEFSTSEVRKIKDFAKLEKMFEIVTPLSEIPYTPEGSIIDISDDTQVRYKYPIVAIGNFEGLHLGHAKILNRLYARAEDTGGEALVLTYRVHTREHFLKKANKPIEPYMILEKEHKENMLFHKFGVHSILYLDFEKEVVNLSAEDFFKKILLEKLHIREIVCGHDTRFGKDRTGDYRLLVELSKPYGIKVRLVEPLMMGDEIVCSRLIREKIKQGEVNSLKRYLSRNYSIVGTVAQGRKIGGKLGFPTLNLTPKEPCKLYPAQGVYITHTKIGNKGYYGLTNIGFAPTIREDLSEKTIENYLYKFSKSIYGQEVKIVFLQYLREEKKFASRDELVQQMKKDLKLLRQYIRVH